MQPRKGSRFLHARQIDGSPKAGTATPVEMTVTRVANRIVYYRRSDAIGQPAAWRVSVENLADVVREWL